MPETTPLRGGRLCLDFANTVDWTAAGMPLDEDTDVLRTPGELVRWGRRLGLVVWAIEFTDGSLAVDVDNERTYRVCEELLAKRGALAEA